MKRRSLAILGVITLFLGAWWLGYGGLSKFSARKADSPAQQTEARKVKPLQNKQASKKGAEKTQVGTATGSTSPAETSTKGSLKRFAYTGWKVDRTSRVPRACIHFSQDLNPKDNLKIADYITLEPEAKFTVGINGDTACLSGLSYSKDYQVTIRPGLKSASGTEMREEAKFALSFGDKPAHVSFVGNGVILPRIGAQGLAIETTNIDKLSVAVYRVGDRMLARRAVEAGQTIEEGGYYYAYQEVGSQIREEIWHGEIDVKSIPNTSVKTIFPLAKTIGELKPGAYVVEVSRPAKDRTDNERARAWRWIIVTDLAFTTYAGETGLDATVRSIQTAKPQANVRVELVAVNNEILGKGQTNSVGRVHFDREILAGSGTMAPKMLMAYGADGDYAVLDLTRSPLDLSAFPIGGRNAGQKVDPYIFTDRGIYRPGETAHITAMIRDSKAVALEGQDGHFVLSKPDGQVFRRIRFKAAELDKNAGTLLQTFTIPKSARRGHWRASVELDGLGLVGSTRFAVEDFVPQKLSVEIKASETPLRLNEIRNLKTVAQFLYGANGANLASEAEARLRVDPAPFKDLKGYHFGLVENEYREELIDLGGGQTDKDGIVEFDLQINEDDSFAHTNKPLRAEVTIGVAEPGGRFVKTSKHIPVRTRDLYLGIKPLFEGRPARRKPANFNIRAVDWRGQPVNAKAEWILVEEDYHYSWYRRNGRWQYRRDLEETELARGTIDVKDGTGVDLAKTLDWGEYRLIVKDVQGKAASSYRFSVGWGGGAKTEAPDQIAMGGPSNAVKAGQTIKLNVNAPYAGVGELVIADSAVRSIQMVKLSEGGTELSVRMPDNLGAGAYALLSLYTPRSADKRPVPRRAVGLVYLKGDVEKQKLQVEVEAPEVTRPRKTETVSVKFANVPNGENVYLTLAAIDEGVLQITKYKSPDPISWYFDKKALNVTVRDDYARLLNPNLGEPTLAKSGGDGLGGEGLTTTPVKVVSLYSGPVKVKGGKAVIPVELPDFNGKLRLMAVAWSRTSVGADVKPMFVRDPVPMIVSLPRFLAPGDKALATVSLDNVEGKPGDYHISLQGDGAISVENRKDSLHLAKGERKTADRKILSAETGLSTIKAVVKGPGGYKVASTYNIQTRSAFMPVTVMQAGPIAPGEKYTPSADLLAGYIPGSVDITVSFSRTPGVDPAAYAAVASRYPYGCSEQTVSAAMPLLYAHELGGVPGMSKARAKQGLQQAVDRLINRQDTDGSFGLWRAGDGWARPYLGVYVTDFLHRAKGKDYIVPEQALELADEALAHIARMPRYPNLNYEWREFSYNKTYREASRAEAAAYAHYVLARNGKGRLSDLRYFADNQARKMRSPLGWGHLGAALALLGDKARADEAFEQAFSSLETEIDEIGYDYYASPTRDSAGILALVKETAQDQYLVKAEKAFQENILEPKRLNTQAQAQVILAIRAFLKDSEPVNIKAKNANVETIGSVAKSHLYMSDLQKSPVFTNKTKGKLWRSVMVTGMPKRAPAVKAEGVKVKKSILTLAGEDADLGDVKQGERFIVMVSFATTQSRKAQFVLADLLPAGMEIEAIIDKDDKAWGFLQDLTDFQIKEMRDDRLVASVNSYGRSTHRIAYLVRAVTPGDYIWPGAVVEDMYRPQVQGITAAERVSITTGNKG